MKPHPHLIHLAIPLLLATTLTLAQNVPTTLNYQGLVSVSGSNFSGAGLFEFALVDGNGHVCWSNDGGAGSTPPQNPVSINVTKGLYTVLLGDSTLTNMQPIPPSVFSNNNLNLRIWFSDGSPDPLQQLTPDQPVASVGYAMVAASASSVAEGATGNDANFTGTLTAGNVVSNGDISLPATNSGGATGVLSIGGVPILQAIDPTDAAIGSPPTNIFLGGLAGNLNTTLTGTADTGIGAGALQSLTSGSSNTAVGSWALLYNTSGSYNTATGIWALSGYSVSNTGSSNTATGAFALSGNESGSSNSAFGSGALYGNTTGNFNTAIGANALQDATGNNNLALGQNAGTAWPTGSYNIYIGSSGVTVPAGTNGGTYYSGDYWYSAPGVGYEGDSGTIYIGEPAVHSAVVLAGVRGAYTYDSWYGTGNAVAVTVDEYGGLGTNGAMATPEGNGGNSVLGVYALNGGGTFCTAIGWTAMQNAQKATNCTAIGAAALYWGGSNNTALGIGTLQNAGYFNGSESSYGGSSYNVALGYYAGYTLGAFGSLPSTDPGDNNVYISNFGPPSLSESNVIRIGQVSNASFTYGGDTITQAAHTATYIAGIWNTTISGGGPVYVNSSGQLGTMTSSRRFKDNIATMDKASEAILSLRPVTFRYKPELDARATPQFGLIAEEVNEINPDLVLRDDKGEIYTVRYEAVNAMLLNEFLKDHRRHADDIRKKDEEIGGLKERVRGLEERLAKLERMVGAERQ